VSDFIYQELKRNIEKRFTPNYAAFVQCLIEYTVPAEKRLGLVLENELPIMIFSLLIRTFGNKVKSIIAIVSCPYSLTIVVIPLKST
jgi:hypothetical protein